jgi:hypothetical protein
VRRDGRWQELPAAQLVPGDMVHLRIGDIVPADTELSDGRLQVDQSQLTGESAASGKDAEAVAYTGSLVTRGEASGVVTGTGIRGADRPPARPRGAGAAGDRRRSGHRAGGSDHGRCTTCRSGGKIARRPLRPRQQRVKIAVG